MFITFEGVDGAGKTTAIKEITKFLIEKGYSVVETREPGAEGSAEAKMIREIILNPSSKLSPMTEAILYSADRREHLEALIWPALKEGKIVLCDRYVDSTLAYQGAGRNLGIQNMIDFQKIITNDTMPDLTIFFDISPADAKQRLDKRGQPSDKLELETNDFKQRVYDGYKKLITLFPERIKSIDASLTPSEVANLALEVVQLKLNIK